MNPQSEENLVLQNTITPFNQSGLTFAVIPDTYLGSLSDLYRYDAIVVRCTSLMLTRQLILSIRSVVRNNVFLKPLYLLSSHNHGTATFSLLIDGVVRDFQDLSTLTRNISSLNDQVSQIRPMIGIEKEKSSLIAFLVFNHSRQIKKMEPVPDRESKMGFYYPILSKIDSIGTGGRSSFDLLDQAEKEGLITGQFSHSGYLCSECLGGFLQYREVCPGCQSSDLRTEELVHHFRCAHVAPKSEFSRSNPSQPLQCPKCHHQLKHIGVDFDKPSSIHHCQQCHGDFQNYWVKAKCLDCGHDQKVEYLVKKIFKEYELTEYGREWIEEGQYFTNQIKNKMVADSMTWDAFVQSVGFHVSEGKRGRNFLVTVSFDNYAEVAGQIGKENELRFLEEIMQMIKASQHTADIRTVKVPHIYFTLFSIEEDEAEAIARRTVFLINHLIRDNLGIGRNVIRYTCEELTHSYLQAWNQALTMTKPEAK